MKNGLGLVCVALGLGVFSFSGSRALATTPLEQPYSVSQTSYETGSYWGTEPAPLPDGISEVSQITEGEATLEATEPMPGDVPEGEVAESYSNYQSSLYQGSQGPYVAKPWRIPQPCFLESHGIDMGGWVQQGITFNSRSPRDRFNGPLLCGDRSNEYELNQAWLYFSKPIDNQGCGWDLGGRVDMFYGTDWRAANSLGLESTINGEDQIYGMALPQFYMDVAYNDLTVRLGHWAPMMGYEVVPAPMNFFYSHHYGICYGQPLVVTGAWANYKIDDQWSVNGGMHRGWNMFEDANHSWDFIGGVAWVNEDKTRSLKFTLDNGPQDAPNGLNDRFVYALVGTQTLTERWSYAIEHDLGYENNGAPGGADASWYNISQYLFYTINDAWSAGMRVEWFRDNNGARVAGLGNIPGMVGWAGGPGFVGDFTELTFGANWKPNPNVALRPEIRWDWYDGSRDVDGNLPFSDGNRSDQFTFATDLIFTF